MRDLAVKIQLAKAYRAEGEGFLVGLGHQVGSIHEALEVRAVRHAKDVANFVTGCLDRAVEKDFFFGLNDEDAHSAISDVVLLRHRCLLASLAVVVLVAENCLLLHVQHALIPHVLRDVVPDLVRRFKLVLRVVLLADALVGGHQGPNRVRHLALPAHGRGELEVVLRVPSSEHRPVDVLVLVRIAPLSYVEI